MANKENETSALHLFLFLQSERRSTVVHGRILRLAAFCFSSLLLLPGCLVLKETGSSSCRHSGASGESLNRRGGLPERHEVAEGSIMRQGLCAIR